jgi:hypothetical protein
MTKRSSLSKKSLLLASSVEELTGRLYDAVIRLYDDAGNAIEARACRQDGYCKASNLLKPPIMLKWAGDL